MWYPDVVWLLVLVNVIVPSVRCDVVNSTEVINLPTIGKVAEQELIEDNRPLSNNIQKVSKVSTVEYRNTTTTEKPGVVILEWLSQMYNPHHWKPNQLPGAKGLSGECKSSMKVYLTALTNSTLWAALMSDASGRYADQFFFGNDFWLGSKNLCLFLKAPFPTSYHLARFTLNMGPEYTPRGREMSLGVCLPESCSSKDVRELLAAAMEPNDKRITVNGLRVRRVPGSYSIFSDPKFHIMGSVSVLVAILMAIGTMYEAILERRNRKTRLERSNNNDSSKVAIDKLTFEKEQLSQSDTDLVTSTDSSKNPGKFCNLILSFSVLSNGRKILDCNGAPKDALTCVHGIRFMSLAWVVMVHTFLQVFAIAENKTMRSVAEKRFMFQTVGNATFSVDSFFFISGLLVAYLYFKGATKPETDDVGKPALRTPRPPRPLLVDLKLLATKFCTFLGYRFIRLTPAYLFVLGCAELTMKWIKNESVFEPVSNDNINCHKYWWRNALYLNSLYPRKEMCMLWSWYLSNDTQFYVLGTILLLISSRFFRVATAGLILLLISSSVTTALISLSHDHIVSVSTPFILFDELYDKPWLRLGPYLVGLVTGWFVHRIKCSLRISKAVIFIGWFMSLSTLFSLVYGLYWFELSITSSAVYVSIGHTAWGAALAWIVIACTSGNGGCINSLLSCKLLRPLSRLTYCAYLAHPVIMVLTSFHMQGPLHTDNIIIVILWFGNLVASFLVSFLISLAFEAPIVGLLKICLTPVMKKQSAR
ncbi:nose resistant to fluoxetine protein 6-like isoform X2 [Rhodnius prolixus]